MGQGHEGSFSTGAILWGCLLSPWGCPVRTAPFLDGLGPTGDFFRRLLQEISSLEKRATLADMAHLEAGRAPRAIRRGRWGRHLSLTCRTVPDRSSPRFKKTILSESILPEMIPPETILPEASGNRRPPPS
jgi:hypothetical protein